MKPNTTANERAQTLRGILNRQRNCELARVRQFRRDQMQDALDVPSDDLGVARSDLDTELHVSLIGFSEDRLKAIDDALNRVEGGQYGSCAQCGGEIPIERLQALPFTVYCVECQRRRETGRPLGAISEEFATRWSIPEEVDQSLEVQDSLTQPEEQMFVRSDSPFGREEGEFEQLPAVPSARRRGRVRVRRTR